MTDAEKIERLRAALKNAGFVLNAVKHNLNLSAKPTRQDLNRIRRTASQGHAQALAALGATADTPSEPESLTDAPESLTRTKIAPADDESWRCW